MGRALIVSGGWEGHHPHEVAELLGGWLAADGFEVEQQTSLDALAPERLAATDLVVVNWTMGEIEDGQSEALAAAVEQGTGLAGVHGGLCDAFHDSTPYQFLTGGQFVEHPGGGSIAYEVTIADRTHEVTAGVGDFTVVSEQYYLHVDPANHVLATTRFPVADGPHAANGPVDMPVAWTRLWGRGRVFYCSLGHEPSILAAEPVSRLCRQGFRWAARTPR